jgi:hypothetical protein
MGVGVAWPDEWGCFFCFLFCAGVGVSRLVRWTPARGQEGQEYQFCFSAIGWTNVSSAAVKVAINLAGNTRHMYVICSMEYVYGMWMKYEI